jgi:thioredoxin-like negative regulator of GroEL
VATQTAATPAQQAPAAAAAPPLPSWLQRLLPLGGPSGNVGRRAIQNISAGELDALLATTARQEPLLILFSATWCGPCKIMVQRLESLLKDGTLPPATVVKVDVELEDELATRLKVYKLPTLMVVGLHQDPGHPALRLQGLATSTALLDMVANRAAHLGANLEEAILW